MAEEQAGDEFSRDSTEVVGVGQEQSTKSTLTKYKVPIGLILFGFYFLMFAIIELITNYSQTNYNIPMNCHNATTCIGSASSLSFPQHQTVYIYLVNPTLTQNDIAYTSQQSNSQISNCAYSPTNQQSRKQLSYTGAALLPSSKAIPCAQFPSYYPQGTFKVTDSDSGDQLPIQIQELTLLHSNLQNQSPSDQWADVESERYRIWNELNVAIGLNKYWGYINPLVSGSFQIELKTTNPLSEKLTSDLQVTLTNSKAFSGRNVAWCVFNFMAGLIQFCMGCISFWEKSGQKYVNKNAITENGYEQEPTSTMLKGPSASF